ncbi:MAG: hypothetical protein HYR94_11055 [Chloroflexi bacterium]|nr:hypothetical protein [Chloroflexota bacterium]
MIAAGWQTITYEGFEGAFPTGGWAVYDTSNDGYERYWNDTSHLAYHEVWSAWPATGGADRLDPETDLYPNNMDTWMIYGPFDLSDASDAQTVFYLWRAIEPTYDGVFFGVSADGTDFYGYSWDGTVDWELEDINFRNIENEWGISFLGDSTVWAGWYFHSPLCHNM